mgnify:CR=1 FL=1
MYFNPRSVYQPNKLINICFYGLCFAELKTTQFLDMSAVTFDICEVCGSYQCLNCPQPSYYLSSSDMPSAGLSLMLGSLLLSLLSSQLTTTLEVLGTSMATFRKFGLKCIDLTTMRKELIATAISCSTLLWWQETVRKPFPSLSSFVFLFGLIQQHIFNCVEISPRFDQSNIFVDHVISFDINLFTNKSTWEIERITAQAIYW